MNNNNKISRQNSKVTRGKGKSDRLVSKQQVKSMIESLQHSVPDKYLNSVLINAYPPVTGTLVTPTFPAQGVTNGQREGDSLKILAIEARVLLYNAQGALGTDEVDLCRIICVQAKSATALTISNSAAPTTGILDLGSGGTIDNSSFINLYAKNQFFHVLYDKSFPCSTGSSASHNFELKLKPKIHKVNFSPTSTTAETGQIFWVFQSTITSGAFFSVVQRLVYEDL
jgi:hypothetical protein